MISVVIPVRNASATIQESIQSVLSQEVKDLEILCVINGTNDNTEEIIRTIKDDRIKILHSTPGIVPALNMGLRNCKGDIIARQDSDDVWLSNKLKKQLDFFDKNSNIDILGTQLNVVDGGNKHIRLTSYPTEHNQIIASLLVGENAIGHPSVIFKRKILDKCAGYFDLFPFAEDLDLWSRSIPWYKFANLNEPLIRYKHIPNPNYNPHVPKIVSAWYRMVYGIK